MAQAADTSIDTTAASGSETIDDAPIQTTRTINWGGIAKGALIITGVILVGVVAASVLTPYASTFFANNPAIVGAAGSAIQAVGDAAITVASFVWAPISVISTHIGAAISGTTFYQGLVQAGSAGVSTASGTVGVLGGAGAAALAAIPAMKALAATPLTHVVAVPDPVISSGYVPHDTTLAATAPAPAANIAPADGVDANVAAGNIANHLNSTATLSKIGHHVVDAGQEANHSHTHEELAKANQASQNWADRVGSSKRAAAKIAPRAASFAEQVDRQHEMELDR